MNPLYKKPLKFLPFLLAALVLFDMTSSSFANPPPPPCLPGLPCVTLKDSGENLPKQGSDKDCDANFMNQIYAKAYLESSRENIMNQVIIRKPDSVLEYTCYDQLARIGGELAGTTFSETGSFHGIDVPINGWEGFLPVNNVNLDVYMGAGRLTNDLDRLVMKSLDMYLTQNFANAFLGRMTGTSFDYIPAAGGPAGSPYVCYFMAGVYFLAKCNDMNIDDPFLSFRTLVTLDPRLLPEACTGGTGITDEIIDVSENKDMAYVDFDNVSSPRTNLVEAPLPGKDCFPPIPTGIPVVRKTKKADFFGNVTTTDTILYNDKFCPNPSCYYDNEEDKCKQ